MLCKRLGLAQNLVQAAKLWVGETLGNVSKHMDTYSYRQVCACVEEAAPGLDMIGRAACAVCEREIFVRSTKECQRLAPTNEFFLLPHLPENPTMPTWPSAVSTGWECAQVVTAVDLHV